VGLSNSKCLFDRNNSIVVRKYSDLLGFVIFTGPLCWIQVRYRKYQENGG